MRLASDVMEWSRVYCFDIARSISNRAGGYSQQSEKVDTSTRLPVELQGNSVALPERQRTRAAGAAATASVVF